MKRIMLAVLFSLLLTIILPAQADDALRIVDGDDGAAFLFQVNGWTLLLGYAEFDALTEVYPEVNVDYVVIVCKHEAHVDEAHELAKRLGAGILTCEEHGGMLNCQQDVVVVDDYAFTAGEKLADFMTFDCRGRYVQFRAVTRQTAVNVRKEPSTRSGRVSRVKLGTNVVVIGEDYNQEGEFWYLVRLDGGDEGYIRADLLEIGENVEEETRDVVLSTSYSSDGAVYSDASSGMSTIVHVSTGASAAASVNPVYARTNDSAINVRTQPSTKSDRIAKLAQGIAVIVLGEATNDQGQKWYHVRLQDGRTGYIRSDLLEAADSLTDMPAPAKTGGRRYIGNKRTMVFHRVNCHTLPKAKNQVYFSSRSYALAKGYRPCDNCDP